MMNSVKIKKSMKLGEAEEPENKEKEPCPREKFYEYVEKNYVGTERKVANALEDLRKHYGKSDRAIERYYGIHL